MLAISLCTLVVTFNRSHVNIGRATTSQSLLLLLASATYIMVLFFTHILFVVNHTINATPPQRLQQQEGNATLWKRLLKPHCYVRLSNKWVHNILRVSLCLRTPANIARSLRSFISSRRIAYPHCRSERMQTSSKHIRVRNTTADIQALSARSKNTTNVPRKKAIFKIPNFSFKVNNENYEPMNNLAANKKF